MWILREPDYPVSYTPGPATDTEAFREVVIDVPHWFKAKIRFKRIHYKRGKDEAMVLDGGERGEN